MPPVYTAQYSKVPVWVLNVKDVNVMRRQGDGWVNATHLLKVADFDKPKRTRILERDVQTGEHEKVQGGYGKYQGTWIPVARAIQLSGKVGILPLVQDLLMYEPQEGVEMAELPKMPRQVSMRKSEGSSSAKRARKVNSAPSQQNQPAPVLPQPAQPMQSMPQPYSVVWPYGQQYPGMPMYQNPNQNPNQQTQAQKAQAQAQAQQPPQNSQNPQNPQNQQVHNMQNISRQNSHTRQGSHASLSAPAPAMNQGQYSVPYGYSVPKVMMSQFSAPKERYYAEETFQTQANLSPSSESDMLSEDDRSYLNNNYDAMRMSDSFVDARSSLNLEDKKGDSHLPSGSVSAPAPSVRSLATTNQYMAEYSSKLLDYFMSPNKGSITSFLLHPQPGPQINVPIDDEGNTVFHWTCAIGQIEIMNALLNAGADPRALNNEGHTPLVRSVLFTNNFETRSFPQTLELLVDTASLTDSNGRTILHHIANTTSSRTRSAGARYYAEILLAKLSASSKLVPQGLTSFVNAQDNDGNTALHIAGRNNSRGLCKTLMIYNASPRIPNKINVTAEELLKKAKEEEVDGKFDESDKQGLKIKSEKDKEKLDKSFSEELGEKAVEKLHGLLMEMAKTYDTDIENKDADIDQVRKLLGTMQSRVDDAEQIVPQLIKELGSEESALAETQQQEMQLAMKQAQLQQLIERTQSRDLAQCVQTEESSIQDALSQIENKEEDDADEREKLEEILEELQIRRRSLVDDVVVLYSSSGAADKIQKYRKLLSICCEIDENEVDGLLDGIASVLKTHE